MIDWHAYPKEKPPEKARYFITVNFGGRENFTDSAVYYPTKDTFVGYSDTDWVKAWVDYSQAYREDDAGEWNVYPDTPPDEDAIYLVTYEDTRSGDRFVCESAFCRGFIIDRSLHYKVLAWMSTPQPYHE